MTWTANATSPEETGEESGKDWVREKVGTPRRAKANVIVSKVDSVAALQGLESEWQNLQDRVGVVPFTSFTWAAPWWKHLARRRLGVSDQLYVHTFREPSGELVGVAPLMLT